MQTEVAIQNQAMQTMDRERSHHMDTTQSPDIALLAAAIVQAQLQLKPAKKDHTNPFFHSKYADLATVWESLHPFRMEGIAITQSPMESPDGYIVLDTQLTHTSGQWMRSRLKMRVGKDDPQGAGSALTYARRYSLGCMTGLVTEEDDDANAASPQTFAQKFPAQAKAVPPYTKDALECEGDPAGTVHTPAQPSAAYIWRVGKHKGESIATIPTSYLEWFAREGKLADHREQANWELDRRNSQTVLTT